MGICFFKTSFVLSNSVLNTIEFMLTIRVCFFLLTYVFVSEKRMIWSWTTKWCSKYFRYIKVIEPHKQFCKIAYIWWNGWLGPVSYWIWKLIFWLFRYLFKGLELLNNSLILKCLCELPPLTQCPVLHYTSNYIKAEFGKSRCEIRLFITHSLFL